MRRIWILALNDLRLTARDRPALFWTLALPVALMAFFGGLGGGGGDVDPPRIALTVADRDGGWLARALTEELEDEQIALDVVREGAGGGPAAAEGGAGPDAEPPRRRLLVPADFTEALAVPDQQRTLVLETSPGSNTAYDMAAQVHVVRASVRLVARMLELEGDPEFAALDPERKLERFRELAARPRLVSLEVSQAGRGQAVPSGTAQSVPGILSFTVLMMTLIYGAVFLTIEKSQGMLRRQATTPASPTEIIAGKLLGRVLLAGAQIGLLVLAGWLLFGVSWGSSPLGLVLMLASYAAAVAALSTLLGAVVANPAQASIVGWIAAMVMAALGGSWWPSEVMPAWMRAVGHLFPTAWAMDGFHALISFGAGAEAVLLPAAVLLAYAAGTTLVAARLLRGAGGDVPV